MADPATKPGAPRKRGRPRQEQPSPTYLAKQAEIIDVAIGVFKERGFDQGNLDDVAASLGTGRASLYHYVPSKAHLLYLIFDRAISTTLQTMDRLAAIPDPGLRLRALIRQQVHTIAANPGLFMVFFGDRPALDEKYEAEIRAKERRLLRYLIEAVRAASDAGELGDVEPRLAAQALLGMTSWFHKWYNPGPRRSRCVR
jgi:AcrR family transcriptional regulator